MRQKGRRATAEITRMGLSDPDARGKGGRDSRKSQRKGLRRNTTNGVKSVLRGTNTTSRRQNRRRTGAGMIKRKRGKREKVATIVARRTQKGMSFKREGPGATLHMARLPNKTQM